MDDYKFENGSVPVNQQPVDPDYTFENGSKPNTTQQPHQSMTVKKQT